MKIRLSLFPYLLWMAIFVIVPMMLVVFFSFTDSSGSLTFENLIEAGKYSAVFLRSISLGAASTIICLIIGYPAAHFISKANFKYQNIFISSSFFDFLSAPVSPSDTAASGERWTASRPRR